MGETLRLCLRSHGVCSLCGGYRRAKATRSSCFQPGLRPFSRGTKAISPRPGHERVRQGGLVAAGAAAPVREANLPSPSEREAQGAAWGPGGGEGAEGISAGGVSGVGRVSALGACMHRVGKSIQGESQAPLSGTAGVFFFPTMVTLDRARAFGMLACLGGKTFRGRAADPLTSGSLSDQSSIRIANSGKAPNPTSLGRHDRLTHHIPSISSRFPERQLTVGRLLVCGSVVRGGRASGEMVHLKVTLPISTEPTGRTVPHDDAQERLEVGSW
jgi:hypothetical protein